MDIDQAGHSPSDASRPPTHLQSLLTNSLHSHIASHLTNSSEISALDKAIYIASSAPLASRWLTHISSHPHSLTSSTFTAALRHRYGIAHPDMPLPNCACSASLRSAFNHSLVCMTSRQKFNIVRHNAVLSTLYHITLKLGLTSFLEKSLPTIAQPRKLTRPDHSHPRRHHHRRRSHSVPHSPQPSPALIPSPARCSSHRGTPQARLLPRPSARAAPPPLLPICTRIDGRFW